MSTATSKTTGSKTFGSKSDAIIRLAIIVPYRTQRSE